MKRDGHRAGGVGRYVLKIAPTPFFADRGCHVRILEEARALSACGWDATICTYHHGRDIEGLDIRRSLRVPWYGKLSAGPSLHKPYIDVLLLMTVLRACLKRRPDVLHAHLHEGVAIGRVAAALLRLPLVADLQGSLSGELVQHRFVREGGLPHRFVQSIERSLERMPDAIVLSSKQAWPREARGAVQVIPDGVDAAAFHPGPAPSHLRAAFGLPAGAPVVGYLGVLSDYQGMPALLAAMQRVAKRIPAARCLIMGYPDVERYRAQAERMGLAEVCRFTGRVPYDQARDMLALCDVAVSPKLAVSEANGKLLNYMAVGLPVVASDTPVNRELLGRDGIFAPPGDAGALAAALCSLLHAPWARREIGARLRRRAEREFSWASIGPRLVDVYESVLQLPVRPSAAAMESPPLKRHGALRSSP